MMRIIPGDWLTNAGIVGYLRLLKMAKKKNPDLSKESIEISSSDLEGFTETYFTAVLMKIAKGKFKIQYNNTFSNIKSKIGDKQFREMRTDFSDLGENSFRKIKVDYRDFHTTLKSVIDAAELFREEAVELCNKLSKYPGVDSKYIQKIRKEVDKQISDKITKLKDKNLNFIYSYLNTFYRNKNVIGNPSVSKVGRKKSFYKEYVEPAIHQLDLSNSSIKQGFLCRFCKQNHVIPKTFYDVDTIFAEGMFSTTAVTMSFRNFFYNMQPDLFVCNVCELLLICAWAGFTEIPARFRDDVIDTNHIFVNLPSLKLLWDENESIQRLYAQAEEDIQGTIYQDIIQDIFLREHTTKAEWALKNILFIEIKTTGRKDADRPDFRYFHIGDDIAKLFMNKYAIDAFSQIGGKVKIENGIFVSLRRNVVIRILDHDSMYPLCYSLIDSYLSERDQYSMRNVFNISLLSSIRGSITAKIGKEEEYMLESKQIYGILRNIQNEGSTFRSLDYEARKRKSYTLLSMIRNGRTEDFYDVLMKIYMSHSKPIPDSLIGLLNKEDDLGFQVKAYAFMSGFLGDNQKSDH